MEATYELKTNVKVEFFPKQGAMWFMITDENKTPIYCTVIKVVKEKFKQIGDAIYNGLEAMIEIEPDLVMTITYNDQRVGIRFWDKRIVHNVYQVGVRLHEGMQHNIGLAFLKAAEYNNEPKPIKEALS